MTPRALLTTVLMILCCLGAACAAEDADRAFVDKVLQTVAEDDPSTAATAELVFVNAGAKYVPALKEALAGASPMARRAIDSALVRLDWKLDPAKLIRAALAGVPDNLKSKVTPVLLSDESTARAFPKHRFYLVTLPDSEKVPETLRGHTLFVLTRDGKAEQIVVEGGGLIGFFLKNLAPVADEQGVKDAAVSWLELSKEVTREGTFRFKLPIDDVKVTKLDAGWRAFGRVLSHPDGPNTGAVGVTMEFTDKGRLSQVKQIDNLKP